MAKRGQRGNLTVAFSYMKDVFEPFSATADSATRAGATCHGFGSQRPSIRKALPPREQLPQIHGISSILKSFLHSARENHSEPGLVLVRVSL